MEGARHRYIPAAVVKPWAEGVTVAVAEMMAVVGVESSDPLR